MAALLRKPDIPTLAAAMQKAVTKPSGVLDEVLVTEMAKISPRIRDAFFAQSGLPKELISVLNEMPVIWFADGRGARNVYGFIFTDGSAKGSFVHGDVAQLAGWFMEKQRQAVGGFAGAVAAKRRRPQLTVVN